VGHQERDCLDAINGGGQKGDNINRGGGGGKTGTGAKDHISMEPHSRGGVAKRVWKMPFPKVADINRPPATVRGGMIENNRLETNLLTQGNLEEPACPKKIIGKKREGSLQNKAKQTSYKHSVSGSRGQKFE